MFTGIDEQRDETADMCQQMLKMFSRKTWDNR